MTGDVKVIGKDVYMSVNDHDTLEKAGSIPGFFRRLYIAIKAETTGWNVNDLREYCQRHGR